MVSFLYSHEVLLGVVVFELCYPIISFLQLQGSARKIDASFGCMLPVAEKGQEILLNIEVRNLSRILHQKIELGVHFKQQMIEKSLKKQLTAVIDANSKERLQYGFTCAYCGNVTLYLDSLKVYDFLGFFYKKQKYNQHITIGVLPPYQLLMAEVSHRTREFLADSEEYADNKSGDDPSEIFQIRAYQPSDPLHSIHWKLTAKEGELMVKEHGHPLGCVVLIWIDLSKHKRLRLDEVNRLLEVTASISMTLMAEKVVHQVAWFEPENHRIVKKRIRKEEHVYELMHRLLLLESYDASAYDKSYYEEAFKNISFSSVIVIDLQGKVQINGEQEAIISTSKVKQDLDGFVLSV